MNEDDYRLGRHVLHEFRTDPRETNRRRERLVMRARMALRLERLFEHGTPTVAQIEEFLDA